MNTKPVFAVCLILLASLIPYGKASTVSEPDSANLIALATWIDDFIAERDGALPESWDDLFSIPDLAIISRFPLETDNFTERLSFIGAEDQPKYPDGELILIHYRPHSEYVEKVMGLPRMRTGPLRRLFIFRDERGRVMVDGDSEENIQRMLNKTGIEIPPPQPYQIPPLPRPEGPGLPNQQTQQFQPRPMESAEEQAEPSDAYKVPESLVEHKQETPSGDERSGNRHVFWWVAAAVLLLLALWTSWRYGAKRRQQ